MDSITWNACDDPKPMLDWLTGAGGSVADRITNRLEIFADGPRVSDRQLRFWCAALFDASTHSLGDKSSVMPHWRRGLAAPGEAYLRYVAESWADPESVRRSNPPLALRAALLREIVGDPWEPVCLPYYSPRFADPVLYRPGYPIQLHEDARCPYLAPTVLSLAEAAYEQTEQDCDECVDGDVGCPKCEGAGYFYDPPYSLKRLKCGNCDEGLLAEKCKKCRGTGRVEARTLDPQRLLVLADALEETGLPDGVLSRHLRQQERCWYCHGEGKIDPLLTGAPFNCICREAFGSQPKRSPCVPGCWCLELILGKEQTP